MLPNIPQHSIYYRIFAGIAGKILLWILVIIFAIRNKPRLPRTRALITLGDNVLLVKNVTDFGRWTLPGGGIKQSEIYAQSIAREVLEELNIDAMPDAYIFIKQYNKHEIKASYDKICYRLDLAKSPQTKIKLSLEILEVQWFSLDSLPHNLSTIADKMLSDFNQC